MRTRTGRLEALSDGIFAIAMTLLVLELPVPRGSRHLAEDLLHHWPSYAAYVVSFVTVAIVWINHHRQMDGVAIADRTLLELNLLLLLFVALVPWPTGLVSEYLREGDQGSTAAVAYGLVMLAMAASFSLTWLHLMRKPELVEEQLRPRLPVALRRSLVGPVLYAGGTLVALVSAGAAFAIFAAVAVFFALSGRATAGSAQAVD